MDDNRGLDLSREFYHDAVRPLLDGYLPGLPHAAALIGPGSEVLGFDDAMSRDHDWGPRVLLFLGEEDFSRYVVALDDLLMRHLPIRFRGYRVRFPKTAGRHRADVHHVALHTVAGYWQERLGVPAGDSPSAADWLTFPQQRLRALTAGAVFHDEVGLEGMRARYAYYPDDVWYYQMAAVWTWIGQEEHLLGRAGYVGDELGAALLAARMVHNLMRLAFLQERIYMPYAKWLGSAFRQLPLAAKLAPPLHDIVRSSGWEMRQEALTRAFQVAALRHNKLGVTAPLPEAPGDFFDRPFAAMGHHGFAESLLRQIRDDEIRRLLARPIIGGIDLLSDNTDLLENVPFWRSRLRSFYD